MEPPPQPQLQPQPQPQPQPPPPTDTQPPPSSSLPPSSSNPNPNPNPNRPPQQFNRPPWSQPPSQISHFPSQPLPAAAASFPSTARGGIVIGVPAAAPSAPPAGASSQTMSFSPGFGGPQYSGISRGNVPDSNISSSLPSARPPMHGMSNMGMMGSQVRPGGVAPSAVHQQRPLQAARPQNPSNNMPPVPQNFQGHGMLRGSSVTPPTSSTTPSTSQTQQPPHQPWLSSAPHGRPPLPSQSFRPQLNPQSLQQRSHIPQQSSQSMPPNSLPQQSSSFQQQQQQTLPMANQSQENHSQQSLSRAPQQTSSNQQQIARGPGLGNPTEQPGGTEPTESGNRILSKRNIQELVNQIDPSEKLDAEVEDVLVDIAEDFIDSVTTFGCSLAKHRKSNTLEAKDILLHIERAWNMTLPGFSGDEIRTYKKPTVNEVHRERLAVVKKAIIASETVNNKSSAGPTGTNVKGHTTKATPVVGS